MENYCFDRYLRMVIKIEDLQREQNVKKLKYVSYFLVAKTSLFSYTYYIDIYKFGDFSRTVGPTALAVTWHYYVSISLM